MKEEPHEEPDEEPEDEPHEESGEEGDLEPLNVPEDLYISEGDEAADEPNSMSYHEVIIYYLGIFSLCNGGIDKELHKYRGEIKL